MVEAAVVAVALPLMFLPLVVLSAGLQVGTPFTALAGNPPVNAADSDVVLIVLAVPIGLGIARMLRFLAPAGSTAGASGTGSAQLL